MALSLPNSSRSPSTVSSFLGNLPELIGAMSHDPRKCLVVIAEFNNGRYLQLWVDHGNYIKLEVQSNQVRGEGPYLSMEEERRLRSVGFGKPSTYFGPNWWIINDWQKGFLDLFESAWEFRRLSFLEERMYSWTNGRTARGIRLS